VAAGKTHPGIGWAALGLPCLPETVYHKPGWFTAHVFNPLIELTTRLGLSPAGAKQLAVRGRKSGEWRTNPVNPFELDGHTYLLSPRGNTQWARNLRAAGEGELRTGRKAQRFTATEVPAGQRLPMLRLYMDKWAWEVKGFMGIDADASDEELRRIAPDHPVFEIKFED
jgi:deazaflavin-dependent oxidoreductase (nitroreductase family)